MGQTQVKRGKIIKFLLNSFLKHIIFLLCILIYLKKGFVK